MPRTLPLSWEICSIFVYPKGRKVAWCSRGMEDIYFALTFDDFELLAEITSESRTQLGC